MLGQKRNEFLIILRAMTSNNETTNLLTSIDTVVIAINNQKTKVQLTNYGVGRGAKCFGDESRLLLAID
jgi:hypothetical protein